MFLFDWTFLTFFICVCFFKWKATSDVYSSFFVFYFVLIIYIFVIVVVVDVIGVGVGGAGVVIDVVDICVDIYKKYVFRATIHNFIKTNDRWTLEKYWKQNLQRSEIMRNDEPLMSYYIKYKCSKICGKCIMIIIGHWAFYSANFFIFSIDLLSDTLSERTINCSCFRHKGVDI